MTSKVIQVTDSGFRCSALPAVTCQMTVGFLSLYIPENGHDPWYSRKIQLLVYLGFPQDDKWWALSLSGDSVDRSEKGPVALCQLGGGGPEVSQGNRYQIAGKLGLRQGNEARSSPRASRVHADTGH